MENITIPVTKNSFHISKFIMKDLETYEEILDLFEKSLLIKNNMNLVQKTRIMMTRKTRNPVNTACYYEIFLMSHIEKLEILEKNIDTLSIVVFFQNKNINPYNYAFNDNDDRPVDETSINFRFYFSLFDKKQVVFNTFLIPLNFDPSLNENQDIYYYNFSNINENNTFDLNYYMRNIDLCDFENEENKNYIYQLIGIIEHNNNLTNPHHILK